MADGYGIDAFLSDGDHFATTSGHGYPFTSGWDTGNLPEGNTYYMQACLEKGGVDYVCGELGKVTA